MADLIATGAYIVGSDVRATLDHVIRGMAAAKPASQSSKLFNTEITGRTMRSRRSKVFSALRAVFDPAPESTSRVRCPITHRAKRHPDLLRDLLVLVFLLRVKQLACGQ
jgi:hypothetical protein